jgi:hypothetical protein
MYSLISSWPKKLLSTFVLTILMIIGGLIVDPSYLNNPIGEDIMGVSADEGFSMPATTESSVVADGIDPIQIDMKSEQGDFAGDIEVVGADGKILFSNRFALRKYPSGFLPNPAKWQSFLSPTAGKGTYRIRMTQEKPGRAKVFIYQGPFLLRMLILPIVAALLILILSVTLTKSTSATDTGRN